MGGDRLRSQGRRAAALEASYRRCDAMRCDARRGGWNGGRGVAWRWGMGTETQAQAQTRVGYQLASSSGGRIANDSHRGGSRLRSNRGRMGVWGRLLVFVLEHRGRLPPAWLRGWWWEWWFWWWLVGTAEATSIEASGRMTGGRGAVIFFLISYPSKAKRQRDNGTGDGGQRGRGGRMWACRWSSVVAALARRLNGDTTSLK